MDEYSTEQSWQAESIDRTKLYEFMADSLRRVSSAYLGVLLLGLSAACGVYLVTKSSSYAGIWPAQLVYYALLLCHILFRIKRGGLANFLSPDMLFLSFYTMFHLAYVTLYSVNLVPISDYIFYYEASIPKAMFVINLGLLGFLFGFELMGVRSPALTQWPPINRPSWLWESFGIFLMLLALAMHFAGLTMLGWGTIMRYGYDAIQHSSKYSGYFTGLIIQFSQPVMALGITVYAIASALRNGKLFKSKQALALTIFFFIVVILEGDRGPIVKFGVPLLLVRHFFIKRVKTRYLLIMFTVAMVLFAGMGVVRTIVFKPQQMLQEFQYQKAAGEVVWYSPFVEMGGSFLVVDIVTQDVPAMEQYWLGASWRDSLIHIVPFLQGLAIRQGWSTWAPSDWITYTYFGPQASGRAFTVAAEGYLNFGLPGAFAELFIVGLFTRWLMIFFARHPSAMRALIFLGCLGSVILVTRNHFNLLWGACAQIFVAAWLLNMMLGNEPQAEEGYSAEYAE